MRYAVFITGPAGAGKSTFCSALITHAQTLGRTVHLMNLDPAADNDVMDELEFGPNGGLVYCFE
jgi:predicted PilT family ATPase